MLELWLMPQLLQDLPHVVFNIADCHHTSTIRCQHSWIGSCLSNGSAVGDSLPSLRDLQIWPFSTFFFLCGCVKDEVYDRPVLYNPEQLEVLNTKSDCKNWWAFISKCFDRSQISPWCVQGIKWSTYWTCTGHKKLLELLFTMVCI
jgi:hypothetical protein